jgi:basic membrane protein A
VKKLLSVLLAVVMAAVLLAGCGGDKKNEGGSTTPTPTKAAVKIGLSTDEGGVNDKSFNQAADTGIKKAVTDFGVVYKAIESKTKDDYESNLEALIADGNELVFGVGFQMEAAMKNIAGAHTDKKFAIIDTVVDLPNVQSITFQEQEGSFLMGVIAGKMTKTNKVGFIGGKDFDTINKFEAGFTAGVESVNPAAAAGLKSTDGKAYGTMVKYVDDFGDATKGYEAGKALYAAGCDVVYHAAGGVGAGLFKAAKELTDGGKKVWAIGVDMDQAVTLPEYAPYLLSSMIKRVDTATYNATKDVVDGKFQGGKHTVLGLKEDGVGVAATTKNNTPKEVIDLVNKYSDAIKAGTIVVPATRAEATAFKPVEVK